MSLGISASPDTGSEYGGLHHLPHQLLHHRPRQHAHHLPLGKVGDNNQNCIRYNNTVMTNDCRFKSVRKAANYLVLHLSIAAVVMNMVAILFVINLYKKGPFFGVIGAQVLCYVMFCLFPWEMLRLVMGQIEIKLSWKLGNLIIHLNAVKHKYIQCFEIF